MSPELRDTVEAISKRRGESIATTMRDLIRQAAAPGGVASLTRGNEIPRPLGRLEK
jgi:hypothetical protein